jgi:hypothetical protein
MKLANLTLEEFRQHAHEADEHARRLRAEMVKLAIECPQQGCFGMLEDAQPGYTNSSNPPSIWATCDQCGYRTTLPVFARVRALELAKLRVP